MDHKSMSNISSWLLDFKWSLVSQSESPRHFIFKGNLTTGLPDNLTLLKL